jgi:chromosome segregation ATPase
MNNNETHDETNDEVVDHSGHRDLTDQVTKFKIIARDSLRMILISTRLTTRSQIESIIKSIKEQITRTNKRIKVNTYELDKEDTNHPEFENTKKNYEASTKRYKKDIENYEKELKEEEKALEENEKGITAIEKGETKVNSEALAKLVADMATGHALDQISN